MVVAGDVVVAEPAGAVAPEVVAEPVIAPLFMAGSVMVPLAGAAPAAEAASPAAAAASAAA